MKKNSKPWDTFASSRLLKIFQEKKTILDIGGGLRVDPSKNNRKSIRSEFVPYLDKVEYKIMDKVADFSPDLVGDIHDIPLDDSSVDAILCMSVLEHVEEPQKAVREMFRVLKPGGYCYIEVPFLFYYHPMKGYYKDYYRFTYDGLEYMTKDFSHVEIQNIYGPFATVANLLPFFSHRNTFFQWLDHIFKKEGSRQTSFYQVFCRK